MATDKAQNKKPDHTIKIPPPLKVLNNVETKNTVKFTPDVTGSYDSLNLLKNGKRLSDDCSYQHSEASESLNPRFNRLHLH